MNDFPVLDIGVRPALDKSTWTLRLFGLVNNAVTLNWSQCSALPQTSALSDMHCVTQWTQLDMCWESVTGCELVQLANPMDEAQFVTLHGDDDYTTNLPLETLLDDDVLIAHSVLGAPLSVDHGWPARMVVPKRYARKGAKWISAIEFHAKDRPGFWEVRGYHNDVDRGRKSVLAFRRKTIIAPFSARQALASASIGAPSKAIMSQDPRQH